MLSDIADPFASVPSVRLPTRLPLRLRQEQAFEELRCPGNPARADERTSPSSRAALDARHGDFTLTRKALYRACLAARLRGVPERRPARFHPGAAVALDPAQPRPAGRGAGHPADPRH